ncbi:GtrA family protein [Shinella sp. M31]|uniref:GtrA family protein n=1 Tax=Shinella sp. M31 TaxID=3368615 RepID=UPI003BA2655B
MADRARDGAFSQTMAALTPYISLAKRFLTFGGGSLIGAAIDYVATLLLISFLGISPSVALALSMAVSASVVFAYHEKITFPGSKSGWRRRYIRFLLLAIVVYALRALLLHAFVLAGVSVPIALAVVIVIVSVFNFAVSSMLIFLKGSE